MCGLRSAIARLLPCLAVFLASVGCQYDPYADRFVTHKPRPEDVVGRYRLKEQTINREGLQALRGKRSSIELFADSRFIASNIPPGSFGPIPDENFFSSLASGSGTWRIDVVANVASGFAGTKTVWGVRLNSPGFEFDSAELTGARPPYGLIFTVGDPDSGQVMIFEREQ